MPPEIDRPSSPPEIDSPASPPAEVAAAPRGLYVHIPFCVSQCPYCDFVVYAGAAARGPRARIATFLEALHVELGLRADRLDVAFGRPGQAADRREPLETLYLGGGTPSLLAASDLARLIDAVRARFGLADGAEVTLEANPGRDERGDAREHVTAGVTRLSIGAQSLDAGELRNLGRRHSPDDVRDAVAEARAAGIGSISLDLLYDIPDQSVRRWAETLDRAIELRPDHLSLYALTLDDPESEGLTGAAGDHLPTTRGARRWRDRAGQRQDEDRAAAMYQHAVTRLAAAGYDGYEISNWALPGHASRHNRLYWSRAPVEALGPGGHAFDGTTRRWTAASLERYVAALLPRDGSTARLPAGGQEVLAASTAVSERLILGLRTAEGVPAALAVGPPLSGTLEWALRSGLVVVVDDEAGDVSARIALTTRGRLLSNELFARLV